MTPKDSFVFFLGVQCFWFMYKNLHLIIWTSSPLCSIKFNFFSITLLIPLFLHFRPRNIFGLWPLTFNHLSENRCTLISNLSLWISKCCLDHGDYFIPSFFTLRFPFTFKFKVEKFLFVLFHSFKIYLTKIKNLYI